MQDNDYIMEFPNNRYRRLALHIMAVMTIVPFIAACSAEFDIDMPRMVLRRLQYCRECGSALLVTRVQPGVLVRCPDCGDEQPRLNDRYLLSQIYQPCKLCGLPLDPEGLEPGDRIECGNCHTRQMMRREAFTLTGRPNGPGYSPDVPPGTGKKRLLYKPLPENDMTLTGLAQSPPLAPEPGLSGRVQPHPLAQSDLSSLPEPGPSIIPVIRPPTETVDAPVLFAPETSDPLVPGSSVVDVPAVTVDLFGGGGVPQPERRPPVMRRETRDDAVLARVDGYPIYSSMVEAIVTPALKALPDGPVSRDRETQLRRAVLERLVQRTLVVQEAARTGYAPDRLKIRARAAELAPQLAGTRLDPEKEAEAEVVYSGMLARIAEKPVVVSPESVRRHYHQHKHETLQPKRLSISSLIVFQDRAGKTDSRDFQIIAKEISTALEAGLRFDELRKSYDEFSISTGSLTVPEPFPESYYAEEVLSVANRLPAGGVFGPLFMSDMALFGKVEAVYPSEPLPFEQMEREIRKRLEAAESEASFGEWLKELQKRAKIEYF